MVRVTSVQSTCSPHICLFLGLALGEILGVDIISLLPGIKDRGMNRDIRILGFGDHIGQSYQLDLEIHRMERKPWY